MVPRAGIEPATLGLEVLCSIQLSYRGVPPVIIANAAKEYNKVMESITDNGPNPFVANIEHATLDNTNYRTTLWTGKKLQVTLMSIQPGHDIGLEVHDDRDQFLRVEAGTATVYMGPTKDDLQTWQATPDDAVIVPAGTWHNLVNSGDVPLKVYSIYAPQQHPHGTVHVTKADADADEARETQSREQLDAQV